ncbi:YciI family protein [Massilia sp. CF038]|uniref:YciI family protein n=1 Tax=Massilia sp. CF038 TaxID=1881045 RepID=UPI00091DA625|nr:YciI family protein [Massilia sp. CF038]SHG56493.1 YCII-related domain-containing protein [Massilia sp. CF038]
MNQYILFMHNDVNDAAIANDAQRWHTYLASLRSSGCFDGGSAIGAGILVQKDCTERDANGKVTGYLLVRADSIQAAQHFLQGNPTHAAGGTVEIRLLVRD